LKKLVSLACCCRKLKKNVDFHSPNTTSDEQRNTQKSLGSISKLEFMFGDFKTLLTKHKTLESTEKTSFVMLVMLQRNHMEDCCLVIALMNEVCLSTEKKQQTDKRDKSVCVWFRRQIATFQYTQTHTHTHTKPFHC